MKDRIRQVRNSLKDKNGDKMTQAAFAEELGLAKATITAFETGNRAPAESVLKLISQKYGVNETWLLTGDGDMFAPVDTAQEIAQITAQLFKDGDESFKYKLIKLVSQMTDEQIAMCQEMVKKLSE